MVGRWSDAPGCHTFWSVICRLNTLLIGAFPLLRIQFSATLHYVYVADIRRWTVAATVFVFGQVFFLKTIVEAKCL
jgi:hypothetical protein